MSDTNDNKPETVSGEYVRRKPLTDLFKAADADASSNAVEYEDEFHGKYGTGALTGGATVIAPPFLPRQLEALASTNNALMPCIDAMVTNVHETGHVIELKKPEDGGDAAAKEDPEKNRISDFFEEVWPGVPFKSLRKQVGTDIEKTGMGYVEVIRNLKREMLMLRRMDPKVTRLVLLSAPKDAPVEIRRGDTTITLTMPMRYRRYVQQVAGKYIYFKEYGCPFEIDKFTGELFDQSERIRLIRDKRLGSEVISFGKVPDVETPYCVPAWVSQMPSVLGSRKAEEYNLNYFDAGGVPPLMVFVHGGALAKEAKEALQEFLSSKPGAKQGAPVFEAQATGGSLDGGAGSVRVTVERFGSERQSDSMFEKYDVRCEERIRGSWRLPPIFVGKAQDYSFATAQSSVQIAEAQVFKPERDEFDTKINATVMRELDPTRKYVFRSLGVSITDPTQKMSALDKASQHINPTDHLKALNEIGGMSLKPRDGIDAEHQASKAIDLETKQVGLANQKNPQVPPAAPGKDKAKGGNLKKSEMTDVERSLSLAEEVYSTIEKGGQPKKLMELMAEAGSFSDEQLAVFKEALTEHVYESTVDEGSEVARYTAAALMLTVLR